MTLIYLCLVLFFPGALRYQHHPHCTEVDSQASLDMAPGPCGFSGGGRASSGGPMSAPILGGFDSLRGRGGPPGGGGPEDSIDVIDSSKEKTVNFANCVSPPSPHDPGFLGINNESYPCDCCQLDESQFRRSFSHHGQPCVPSMMEVSTDSITYLHKTLGVKRMENLSSYLRCCCWVPGQPLR